jgi:hypothetical protein
MRLTPSPPPGTTCAFIRKARGSPSLVKESIIKGSSPAAALSWTSKEVASHVMPATVPVSVHGATTPSSKGSSCPVTVVKRSGPAVSTSFSPVGRTTRSAKPGCVTSTRQRAVSMIAVPAAGQDTRRLAGELGCDKLLQPTDARSVTSATANDGKAARFDINRQDSIDRLRGWRRAHASAEYW